MARENRTKFFSCYFVMSVNCIERHWRDRNFLKESRNEWKKKDKGMCRATLFIIHSKSFSFSASVQKNPVRVNLRFIQQFFFQSIMICAYVNRCNCFLLFSLSVSKPSCSTEVFRNWSELLIINFVFFLWKIFCQNIKCNLFILRMEKGYFPS